MREARTPLTVLIAVLIVAALPMAVATPADPALQTGVPEGARPLVALLGGAAPPYDAHTDTWYIPGTALPRETADGWQVHPSGGGAPADGGPLVVHATNGSKRRETNVVLSPVPVLSITTESGALPGDVDERGTLQICESDGSGGLRVTETPIEIRLRGNTSRRFPKKSYRVKLVDEAGNKRDLSVAGLREDDDWILNPMYSDTSKIREALSYWLWDEINASGQAARSSRFAFAEVLLNGEYRGLYGVQERVDRKQVGADKRAGIVYKVRANDRPTPKELLACADPETCRGLEVAFAGSAVASPWAPAADYMAILEGGEPPGTARLSPGNTVDYALWSALVQARDGHFKNQYIHCVPEEGGYVLYRIPWDLNHTLGDLWDGDSPGTNFLEYGITRLALDDVAEGRVSAGDRELHAALKARWAELREGTISEGRILERARALYDVLYPAILRDTQRWPECGMGEGSAANIRDIEDYFHIMLPRIDGWVAALGTTAAETERGEDGVYLDR